jgi:hypothetical protein
MEARTTARSAAFIPGASPPEVNTPIFEMVEFILFEEGPKIQLKECFTRRLKVIQISIV